MPITTPGNLISKYRDDKDHFKHVLECLFIPAIEKCGMKPIPPVSSGDDLIQASIINNIESADLVLCDISSYNPNVFFELGCRTALNKPVCYVMDNKTDKIPFDTGIINHYEYDSGLAAWSLKNEIAKLEKHIKDIIKRTDGQNSLWKYFGLSSSAQSFTRNGSESDKLDLLIMEIESLKNRFTNLQPIHVSESRRSNNFSELLNKYAEEIKLIEETINDADKPMNVQRLFDHLIGLRDDIGDLKANSFDYHIVKKCGLLIMNINHVLEKI